MYRFEVYRERKSEIICAIVFFSLIVVLGSLLWLSNPYSEKAAVILTVGLLLGNVPVLGSLYSTIKFRIIVDGTSILVRTAFNGCYDFNIADIKKIICGYRHNWRAGDYPVIQITAKKKKLEVPNGFIGFAEMATYLLENYERGVIKNTAISASHLIDLSKWSKML